MPQYRRCQSNRPGYSGSDQSVFAPSYSAKLTVIASLSGSRTVTTALTEASPTGPSPLT